jgi:hypothetical protein
MKELQQGNGMTAQKKLFVNGKEGLLDVLCDGSAEQEERHQSFKEIVVNEMRKPVGCITEPSTVV